jgi:UDP-N-acetylglucosamine--N-acetylmuramyl-(pentapeptide) pyrophosphoryl-undecaprenol N-acetylglucosamine transferase
MKILITGGHLTPALSFIDYVSAHHPQDKIVFVGREFSQDATAQKAVEQYEVEKRRVLFIPFQAVKLGAGFFNRLWQQTNRFTQSIHEAKQILQKQRPQLVLSFGGYVAVPFALAARSLRVPVVTHEQTLVSGFANKLIGLIAKSIAVSFPESVPKFLARKTVVTGNPLREGVFQARHPQPSWLTKKIEKPIVLVLGGNQGSQKLNTLISQSLSELLTDWTIVHQCGRPTQEQNVKTVLERQRNRLPLTLQRRYYIHEWIDDHDLFWLYRHAFCALSRAGANATQELAVSGLPSILVPLPTARLDEQRANAQWLVKTGGAMLLEQSALSTATLLESLNKMKTFESAMRQSLASIQLPENAAERLYEVTSVAMTKS